MLFAGCVVDRLSAAGQGARFAELRLRSPLPRVATLRGRGLPGMQLALRAPSECVTSPAGLLVVSPELERALGWLDHAADALGAAVIVVPTPIELTPGARGRALLRTYSQRLARRDGRSWVWAPRGPWDPDATAALAGELDLVLEFDPSQTPRPFGPIAYGRLRGLGHQTRLSEPGLARILEAIEPTRGTAYLAVEGPHAVRHASRLQQLADALGARGPDPVPDEEPVDDLDSDEDLESDEEE